MRQQFTEPGNPYFDDADLFLTERACRRHLQSRLPGDSQVNSARRTVARNNASSIRAYPVGEGVAPRVQLEIILLKEGAVTVIAIRPEYRLDVISEINFGGRRLALGQNGDPEEHSSKASGKGGAAPAFRSKYEG